MPSRKPTKRFEARQYGKTWRVFNTAYQMPLTNKYDTQAEAEREADRQNRFFEANRRHT